jgi:glycerophosphoryl diester phosphodiesterase
MRRLRAVLIATVAVSLLPIGMNAGAAADRPGEGTRFFDVQAHRGGIGLTVENTIASFSRALDLGVSTLELDVQITEDGYAVVTHDRDPNPTNCRDSAPAFAGDPEFPYVPGVRYLKDLTLAQVRTLDCGSQTLPQFPGQQAAPGARMPLLSEVLDLVNERRAHRVWLNIDTKVEADAPTQTAPREQFVHVVAREVRDAGLLRQVSIQSFDWDALMRMRQVEPRLPLVALTNGQQFLQAGQPGASPWLGGIDIDDFGGDLVAATHSFGADAISPFQGDPQNGGINDPGFRPYVIQKMVDDAHALGMDVIPWTVDDPATMQWLIDLGVDGIIPDYPDRLRTVLEANGYKLPRAYPALTRRWPSPVPRGRPSVSLGSALPVQRQVQLQHVDVRRPDEPQVPALGCVLHQLLDSGDRQPALVGHPVHLQCRVLRRDAGVQARRGRGHRVGGHLRRVDVVELRHLLAGVLHRGHQVRRVRAQVRPTRRRAVVPRRRGPRLEVLRQRVAVRGHERLADQRRPDHLAVPVEQRPTGPAGHQLGEQGDRQRVHQPQYHGGHEQGTDGGHQLAA